MATKLNMRTSTPELLWHGGGNENGKPDPVFAVDINAHNILATAGIDASVPPKGSVRLWCVDSRLDGQDFIVDLCDHQSAVNVVRFSPCGRFLASASDKQIVIYCATSPVQWASAGECKLERIWIRPSLDEIYDLQWSPDSLNIIAGSIDSKAEIIRIIGRDSLLLPGHTSYVQGVAWDPLNQMVATQSADRSIRFHQLKTKLGAAVKLQPRGHITAKMLSAPVSSDPAAALTAADFGMDSGAEAGGSASAANRPKNLFADSTVPSFFRRPAFSPDGALVVAPTGIYRPADPKPASAPTSSDGPLSSFCTYIFSRDRLSTPLIALTGLEDPSVAVRFSPVLYKLVRVPGEKTAQSMIPGAYRFVFAVVTVSGVLIYDTQHPHPIARVGGMHWACINDAAWSPDGLMLTVCSSDGYLTFVRFAEGSLGTPFENDEVPDSVKRTFPAIYGSPDSKVIAEVSEVALGDAARQPSAESSLTVTQSIGESGATAAHGGEEDKTDSDQKRRRVIPAAVASSDSSSVSATSLASTVQQSQSTPVDQSSPSAATITAAATAATATATPAVSGVSKKKRIAPTLIAPVAVSESCLPTPVEETQSVGTCAAPIVVADDQ